MTSTRASNYLKISVVVIGFDVNANSSMTTSSQNSVLSFVYSGQESSQKLKPFCICGWSSLLKNLLPSHYKNRRPIAIDAQNRAYQSYCMNEPT